MRDDNGAVVFVLSEVEEGMLGKNYKLKKNRENFGVLGQKSGEKTVFWRFSSIFLDFSDFFLILGVLKICGEGAKILNPP